MTTGAKARNIFDNHMNCAESVSKAVVEDFFGPTDVFPRIATPFGGGVGSTYQELCGALTGALMSIGFLLGRNSSLESADEVKAFSAQFRNWFLQEFQYTQCQAIRNDQEKAKLPSCSDIVEITANKLAQELQKKGFHLRS